MKKNFKGIFIVMLVLTIIVTGCRKKEDASDQEKLVQVFNVTTEVIGKGLIANYIKLGGDVTTETNVDVYPEVQYGKIIQINVILGEYVRKGDVLVVVDPSRPGSSFASNPVIAPISGYVTSLYAQLGAVVSGQVPVVRIGVLDNPKDIYIKTFVPERYVSDVKKGTTAEVTFSYAATPYKATVSEVSPIIDPLSRTFEIWLRFDNYHRDIKIGSYPDIKLFIEVKDNVVKVPADSVLIRNEMKVVFLYQLPTDEDLDVIVETDENLDISVEVVEDFDEIAETDEDLDIVETVEEPVAIAKMVEVETGIRIDGEYEIKKGLSGGELLIVRGNSLLLDGAVVRDLNLEVELETELEIETEEEIK